MYWLFFSWLCKAHFWNIFSVFVSFFEYPSGFLKKLSSDKEPWKFLLWNSWNYSFCKGLLLINETWCLSESKKCQQFPLCSKGHCHLNESWMSSLREHWNAGKFEQVGSNRNRCQLILISLLFDSCIFLCAKWSVPTD